MHTITQGDSATSSTSVVSDDEEDVPVKKKSSLWDSFNELRKKKSTDLSTNEDKYEKELSLYCNAEYIERKEDPLAWWKRNMSRFQPWQGLQGSTWQYQPCQLHRKERFLLPGT